MGPGLDLDDGRDAIALDPGHDAREVVAGGLGDDRPRGRRASPFLEEPRDLLDLDEPLAALGALHREAAFGLPAPERLDGDAEHLGRLADPDPGWRFSAQFRHTAEYCRSRHAMSRSFGAGIQK